MVIPITKYFPKSARKSAPELTDEFVRAYDSNWLPISMPISTSLQIVFWATLGPSSTVVVEKLHFLDAKGANINHTVKKLSFSPQNALSILGNSADSLKHCISPLFIDPTQVVDAVAADYSRVEISFGRSVTLGAVLFSLSKKHWASFPKTVMIYSQGRLIFNGGVASLQRVQRATDTVAAIVFNSSLTDSLKGVHPASNKQVSMICESASVTY